MKNKYIILGSTLATLLVGFSSASAQTLVAHYEFENALNLGLDSSGNGHDLIAEGTGAAAGLGTIGSGAASFDGGGVLWEGKNVRDIVVGLDAGFSYALWIDPSTVQNGDIVLSNRGSSGVYLQLHSGEVRHVALGANAGTADPNASYAEPGWTHVAVTVDNTNLVTTYLNGAIVGSSIQLPSDPDADLNDAIDLSGDVPFAIGARNNGLSNGYEGLVDDVRIYQGVLSAQDVAAVYAIPEPGSFALLAGAIALGSVMMRRRCS